MSSAFTSKPLQFTRYSPNGLQPYQTIDTTTDLIIQTAQRLGIQVTLVDGTDVIELKKNEIVHYVRNRAPTTSLPPAGKICLNKETTKVFLKRAGIHVTNGFVFNKSDTTDYLQKIWDTLQKPLVAKPTHGTHGDEVKVNIQSFEELEKAIRSYFSTPVFEGGMLIEEQFQGKEYRLQATKEKLLGVLEKIPAHVVGDGTKTIELLINEKNTDPMRNISESLYPHIRVDDDLLSHLATQSLTLQSIPTANQHVYLRKVANIMAGGEAIDRTDDIHPSVAQIAIDAINAIPGLSWGGVDFMTSDLSKDQANEDWIIIEVNPAAEFDMHELPMQGKPRPIAYEFLKLMFPDL